MSLSDKLRAEVGTASWRLLAPHHQRGGLVCVDGALDLVEVGVAVAQDDAGKVRSWMDAGQIVRVTDDQAGAWAAQGQAFAFLIVQPFVLVTPIEAEA
ncbi:MAG: DUF2288 family protein [Alphaproteobacteria bacterium]|nr:DUF2288 family protein [Alphaproteobacteria bacterium]